MLSMKLMRLIERHSEDLSRELATQIRHSDRTSDFRKIAPQKLQLAAVEVYRNLGEWLLQKTEGDIAGRFRTIAAQRAAEGIKLAQLVWALTLTRDHLLQFLRREALADSIVQLHGELELHQLLNQFFDRAIYYAIQGYETTPEGSFKRPDRLQELAVSVGLISASNITSKSVED
jgi:hypothetical protein